MNSQIINRSKLRIPRTYIEVWLTVVDRGLKKELRGKWNKVRQLELVVVFLDTSDAKKLNFQFRKKNYATDILSFESDDP